MKVLKFLDEKFELMLLGIMLAVFTALMFANVVLGVFGESIIWGDELCKYCLVASTFLSIPIWIRRRSGIRVDAALALLPQKVQKGVDLAVYAFMVVFFGFLFIAGLGVYNTIAESGQVSAAMQMPVKYLYMVVELGFALSVIRAVQVMVIMIRKGHGLQQEEAS